jgi:hypothetical protein
MPLCDCCWESLGLTHGLNVLHFGEEGWWSSGWQVTVGDFQPIAQISELTDSLHIYFVRPT